MEEIIKCQEKIDMLKVELQNVKGTECEVYSRIIGYMKNIKDWNLGKKEEFAMRLNFKFSSIGG